MARTKINDLARQLTPDELKALYGGTGHVCDELCHHAGESHGAWQEAGGLGKGHNPGEEGGTESSTYTDTSGEMGTITYY